VLRTISSKTGKDSHGVDRGEIWPAEVPVVRKKRGKKCLIVCQHQGSEPDTKSLCPEEAFTCHSRFVEERTRVR